ncbi:TolC family protein [Phenylobacterium montanum]|nr:TolC family protein [Caulobacter sp. S6]
MRRRAGAEPKARDREGQRQFTKLRSSAHRHLAFQPWASLALALILALGGGAVKGQTLHPPVASPPAPKASAIGPPVKMSLVEAVFLGLRDNRTIKSAYIERVAQKFDLFVAEQRFRPTALLSASIEATRQGGVTGTATTLNPTVSWLTPTGAQFQFSWSRLQTRGGGADAVSDVAGVSFTQPLLRGGGLAVNAAPIKQAQLQERINRLQLKSTVTDTVSTIILAYRNLLQAQEQLGIARQSLQRAQDQMQTDQALVDAGRMAAADLVQTRADIASQQVALLQAEQQRNSAQLALLGLLAMDLHVNIVAADSLKAEHVAIDVDRAVSMALDARPDYLSQRAAVEQARQGLIVARNDRLWTLSVTGGVQRQTERGGGVVVSPAPGTPLTGVAGLPGTSGALGLELRIPLGDYTLQQGEVTAATALRSQEMQLADLRERVEAEVRDAVQGVELSWRQVEAAEIARGLAAQTLQMERERLQAGRTSNFEVLTYVSNLRVAETQALSAEISYLDALTTLDQQLGATLDTWKIALRD